MNSREGAFETLEREQFDVLVVGGGIVGTGIARDLSLRGRKAAHFFFSKGYCGSPRVGYGRTEAYARGQLDLATAMAISGAAVRLRVSWRPAT